MAQLDAAYWRALCPELHIGDPTVLRRAAAPLVTSVDARACQRALISCGYFELPPPDDDDDDDDDDDGGERGDCDMLYGWGVDVAAVARGVEALAAAGWPPLYVLAFDEVWVMRARLAHVLRSASGCEPNYDFAAFHVGASAAPTEPPPPPAAGPPPSAPLAPAPAGWPPQRDRDDAAHSTADARGGAADDGAALARAIARGFRSDGSPRHVTCWIALTDATPASSCLHVVPKPHDPGYLSGDRGRSPLEGIFGRDPRSFRAIRALPTPAGGALVFSHRLVHWGSEPMAEPAAPPRPPRIAVAFGCSDERDDDAAAGLRGGAARGQPFARRGAACLPRAPPADAAAHAASADVFDERALGGAPALGSRLALAAAQSLVYARASGGAAAAASAGLGDAASRARHWALFARAAFVGGDAEGQESGVFAPDFVALVAAERAELDSAEPP